jgi:hypothetical protein
MKSDCCNSHIHLDENRLFCTNCLQYCKSKINYYTILLYIIVFIILSIISLDLTNKKVIFKITKHNNKDIVLNKDSIFNALVQENILFPELVIKQVLVETNHLKSKILFQNKNLFGIKYIKQKLAVCKLNGHAKYNSYRDCIKDYKRLQQYYLNNIQEKYAEDKNYTKLLTQIK